MILQALTNYYETLLTQGKITPPGWATIRVSYGIELDTEGQVVQLYHLQQEISRGKKQVLVPRAFQMPAKVKKSSNVAANFLCDNSSYMLGVDNKENPSRTVQCFAAAKDLHLRLLSQVSSPAAQAIVRYFETWDPTQVAFHPVLQADLPDLLKGGDLTFWYNGALAADDAEIKMAWQRFQENVEQESGQGICLVTGHCGPLARLHANIKGVAGAQSSGASLVSFNEPAFCSYGHEQGANAPTGQYAAFAYTTALNKLLEDKKHVCHVGDTTIVFWADGGGAAYQGFAMDALFDTTYSEQDLLAALHHLAKGDSIHWEESLLNPDMPFYVLGLAPNAARLSIRFFWQSSFGALARNLALHYERLKIVRRKDDNFDALPIWRLVQETVRKALPGARPAEANPRLVGDLLLAVLNDAPYPATLLNGVVLRIRAERTVTRGKAAILKAYYLNNSKDEQLKEVLTVELNETTNYLPYVLGRLFSVLENVQLQVNPRINTTITDRYFNSASATPAVVFPTLINLAQKHLAKMNKGQDIYFQKQISELCSRITQTLPARMSLSEQSAFQLGYYHETQNRYKPKEEKNNV